MSWWWFLGLVVVLWLMLGWVNFKVTLRADPTPSGVADCGC